MRKFIELNNLLTIPQVGLGVWQLKENTKEAVTMALNSGYRHIDTAAIYKNEVDVGEAIRESGIARSRIYITTKLWNHDVRIRNVREALERSLKNLQISYIDLYLIHWPADGFKEAYLEMEKLMLEGKIRSIGVSNFKKHHLEELMSVANIMPVINQMEFNPLMQDNETLEYCKKQGIAFEAWSPLGNGACLDNPIIKAIGEKYHKSVAQVILNWLTSKDMIVIPKSTDEKHIIENTEIFDFKLTDEELKQIDELNENKRSGPDPDNFDF